MTGKVVVKILPPGTQRMALVVVVKQTSKELAEMVCFTALPLIKRQCLSIY